MFHYVSPNLSGALPFSTQWKHLERMQSHFHCAIKHLLMSMTPWNTCFRYHSSWDISWLALSFLWFLLKRKENSPLKKISGYVHWNLSLTTFKCSAISFWTYFPYYNLWKVMKTIKLSEKLRIKTTIDN